ncbi:hypothetical protein BJ508DRAFT_417384 [Ascobolus immersus RN42]|uniref:Uncharacterized protein n=1 Tax=Ascobolus immersus RN42 TaxID=1160509 RepID=A0A3N4HWJ1_ASCIM|nr:hypothetical protein BJ508DRAFT_417384 [Ascobolus immersus RN42]
MANATDSSPTWILHNLTQSHPADTIFNTTLQFTPALTKAQEAAWYDYLKHNSGFFTSEQGRLWLLFVKYLGFAIDYAKENPGRTALFALQLGLLANPVAMAGFGAAGPIGGSFAAAWQAVYAGAVPAGGLFANAQRFGMVYPHAAQVLGAAGFIPDAVKKVVPEAAREKMKEGADMVMEGLKMMFPGFSKEKTDQQGEPEGKTGSAWAEECGRAAGAKAWEDMKTRKLSVEEMMEGALRSCGAEVERLAEIIRQFQEEDMRNGSRQREEERNEEREEERKDDRKNKRGNESNDESKDVKHNEREDEKDHETKDEQSEKHYWRREESKGHNHQMPLSARLTFGALQAVGSLWKGTKPPKVTSWVWECTEYGECR